MNNTKLIDRYQKYVLEKRKPNGDSYGKAYVKDKLSRLRKMLQFVDARTLNNINGRNFLKVCDVVMDNFKQSRSKAGGHYSHAYGDYLVVIRQLYEMNTGVGAPRYVHYGGKQR